MADGQIKKSAAGRLLKTAGGKLKSCQCCTTDTEVLYHERLNCCNQCRSAFFPNNIRTTCTNPDPDSLVFKWRGRCYATPGPLTDLTLAEAEATGRPVVTDPSEVECVSDAYTTCGQAQTAAVCPACSECCLRWYPSKACLVGDVPSNPQNSVCCNLGRQARYVSTCTFVNYAARVGLWYADASGCHFTEDSWVITQNDAYTETVSCRWRATCPVASPCATITENTRTQSGVGAPFPGTTTADCGLTTTLNCSQRAVVPGGRSFCNAYRAHPCQSFSCTGDLLQKYSPGNGGCTPEPLYCGDLGCADCNLDTYPCYSLEISQSWSCYRSCRSGSWSRTTTSTQRPYAIGWYCPGSLCESQIIGVCETNASSTTASVCEWEFIVEDEEGCLSDNVCFQYNGECLEVSGIGPPEEICSDPSCDAPPSEEMAPLFAGDEAGGGF